MGDVGHGPADSPGSAATAQALAQIAARRSYGRLLAFVAARTRDIAAAEDALAEAFASALQRWPLDGVPAQPEAWLLTAARRRLIDAARRAATQIDSAEELLVLAQPAYAGDDHAGTGAMPAGHAAAADGHIPDDRLRLMFACAHPGIAPELRAPLMLQTVLGLDAASIASAFRVAPSAMGQRLVRGKLRIRQAGIPFRVPEANELPERLGAVLAAIYTAYSEGWSDPAGAQPQQRALAEEALWLGGLTAALLPNEPEALGLLALMLYLEARQAARRSAQGEFVPLDQQDVALWDGGLIHQAETLLKRAAALQRHGRYQIEAALQSAHAAKHFGRATDWPAIVALYDALAALTASPVVAINRAVALAQVEGTAAGLAALEAVGGAPQVAHYQPYWAARAELLSRSGQRAAAQSAYAMAIGLEIDPAVRRFLQRRAQAA